MKSELKKTIGHAGIYSLGVILSRAISFLMLPIYTRYLSPSDYGVLEILEVTVDIVSIFTGMGIVQGLFKFYQQYEGERDKKELVSTLFILVILFYATSCFLGGLFSSGISSLAFGTSEYRRYILVSFMNLFLSFLIYVPLAYVQAKHRSAFFVSVNAVKLAMQLSLNILMVVYLGMGVLGVLYSTLISCAAVGGVLTFYTFAKVKWTFSKEKALKLLTFGYPFVFSGLGAFILTYSDRYFLNYYSHLSNVGIYSLGYKFGFLLMTFPVRPVFNIWMVQRFEILKKENYEELFNQFLAWFVIVTLSVALFIALGVEDLLKIMSSPLFWDAYKIVPIILLAYFFQACTDFFNFGILHSGKTKHMAYATTLSAGVIIVLSFVLIPRYGIHGAAWVTSISFAIRLLYVYVASQNLFRIGYKLGRPAGAAAVAVAVFLTYAVGSGFTSIFNNRLMSGILKIALLAMFYILLFALGIIKTEERRYVFSLLTSPRKLFAATET